jgi:site-specific DNA-methyltransferase (adenine-specific)
MIYYKKSGCYNPQKTKGHPRKVSTASHKIKCKETTNYNNHKPHSYDSTERHPKSVWYFPKDKNTFHPTQKPVNLIKNLILTYSNENDLVLDNTAGSGTTGEACILTNRRYILIDEKPKYVNYMRERLKKYEYKLKF